MANALRPSTGKEGYARPINRALDVENRRGSSLPLLIFSNRRDYLFRSRRRVPGTALALCSLAWNQPFSDIIDGFVILENTVIPQNLNNNA